MSHEQQGEKGFSTVGDAVETLFPPGQLPKIEPAPKPKRKKAPKPKNDKLAKAAVQILRRPDQEELAYLSREFVQCSLPYRDPGDIPAWIRRNGNTTLIIQPGIDDVTGLPYGLPFGEDAKLLSIWTETAAVGVRSAGDFEEGIDVAIPFGPSYKEFLLDCGCNLETGWGKRGAAARMQNQMFRFFNSKISIITLTGDAEQGAKDRDNMNVANKIRYWWDYRQAEQDSLFESKVYLSYSFFKAITDNPVPLDLRVVKALKNGISQSAFALDTYIWTTHRLYRMGQVGQPEIAVPLEALQQQFGAEFGRVLDFKKAFIKTLHQVQTVAPHVDFSFNKNVFLLKRGSGLPVIPKPSITPSVDLVGETGIAQFRQEFPGQDVYGVIAEFYPWREEKGEVSANTDKHFMAFARTWMSNRGLKKASSL